MLISDSSINTILSAEANFNLLVWFGSEVTYICMLVCSGSEGNLWCGALRSLAPSIISLVTAGCDFIHP